MNRTLIILAMTIVFHAFAQPKSNVNRAKVYKLKVFTKSNRVKSGYLRSLNDSTMVISSQPLFDSPLESISYKSIAFIRVRGRQSLWKTSLLGAAGGALLGSMIGLATYEKPDCSNAFVCIDFGPGFNMVAGAFFGGVSGALIGLAAGSSSRKIQIKQNQNSGGYIYGEMTRYVIQPKQ